MNLIEELARQYAKNHGYLLEEVEKAPLFEDFIEDSKSLLPIFAEWIKQVKNPYIIHYVDEFEVNRKVFLSELEKMKNPVNIGGK